MSVLDEILDGVRADLAERQQRVSLDELKAKAARQPPTRDPMPMFRSPGVSVIAEVKRSSPSRGALAEISDLLNSVRGLVVEAANTGAISAEERAANQLQIDSAIDTITRGRWRTLVHCRKVRLPEIATGRIVAPVL